MVMVRSAAAEDAAGIAGVYVDAWRSTYRGMVPESYLARMSVATWEHHWRRMLTDPASDQIARCAFVAGAPGGGVVGFATGCREWSGTAGFEGELDEIYILKGYQRQGIGRILVGRVAEHLRRQGCGSLLAWVAAGNTAVSFYEALGGVRLKGQRDVSIGGARVRVVAYGWTDLRRLIPDFRGSDR